MMDLTVLTFSPKKLMTAGALGPVLSMSVSSSEVSNHPSGSRYNDAPQSHHGSKKEREEVFRGIIMFGISPMTTEFVHRPRCAFLEGSFTRFAHFLALSRERVPCHQTLRRNTSTVLQNTMAVRGTCRQVSGSLRSFVLHKPSIDSHTDHASPRPIFASMKLS